MKFLKTNQILFICISLLSIGCIAFYTLSSTEEEPIEEDTGRSREETERFMREIGYVQ